MSRYASGKYAKGVSDRSGRAYPLRRMLIEWNGMLVGPDEYESKQPQLAPKRVRADPEALRVSRPARTEPEVAAVLPLNAFRSGSSGSAIITVIESASGYSITVPTDSDGDPDADFYTFSASSGTATVGNLSGGGGVSSAGPVTLPALPVVDLGNGYIT